MNNWNVNAVVKTYRTMLTGMTIAVVVLDLLAIYFIEEISLMLVVMAVVMMAHRFAIRFLYGKYITGILIKEGDPAHYKATLEAGRICSRSAIEHVMAAYYTGDYQRTVDICCWWLKSAKTAKQRCPHLSFLARVYFSLGDNEKLRLVCEAFDRAVIADPQGEQLRKGYTIFRFYDMYLKGDYVACKGMYASMLTDKRYTSSVYEEGHVRYTYGVCCYLCGDLETARQQFDFVVQNMTRFPAAERAHQYLEAINTGTEYRPDHIDMLPNDDFEMPLQVAVQKKVRIIRIVALVCFLVMIGMIVYTWTLSGDFKADVRAAVAEQYDAFTTPNTLAIRYNGDIVSTMCFCDTEQDGVIAGFLYSYGEEDTIHLQTMYSDIEVGKLYHTDTIPEGYTLVFRMYDSLSDIPDDIHQTTEVKVNGKTYYIGIVSVEQGSLYYNFS